MKDEYSHSDKTLRNKVEGLEMTPPPSAWTGIEQGMSASSRSRRKGFFYLSIIFLVVLMSASTVVLLLLQTPGHPSKVEPRSTLDEKSTAENKRSENSIAEKRSFQQTDKETNEANDTKARINEQTETERKSQTSQQEKRLTPDTNAPRNSNLKTTSSTKGNSNTNTSSSKSNAHSTAISKNDATVNEGSNSITSKTVDQSNSNASKNVSAQLSSDLKQSTYLQPKTLNPLATSPSGGLVSIAHKMSAYKKGAWSAEAGLGISQFQYKASSGSPSFQQGIKDAQTGEQGMEAFALVNYHFNSYLSLHSGMLLSQEKNTLNYTTSTTTSEWTVDTIGWTIDTVTQVQTPIVDSNYVTTTSTQPNQVFNQSSYLTFPIGVMFTLPIGVRSEIGLRASALVGFRTKSQGAVLTDLNGNTVDMNSAYVKSGILTFNAAFRYTFALNEKNKIYLEPWIGFGLNNRSTPVLPYDSKFNASGLRIGFRRQF